MTPQLEACYHYSQAEVFIMSKLQMTVSEWDEFELSDDDWDSAPTDEPLRGLGGQLGSGGTDAVIQAVVAFANGDKTPGWNVYANETEHGDFFDLSEDQVRRIGEAEAKKLALEEIETDRKLAKEMLMKAHDGALPLTLWVSSRVTGGARSNVVMAPFLTFPTGRRGSVLYRRPLRMRYRLRGPTRAAGWILFAAALLASEAKGEATRIGHCQFTPCGRFFVVPSGGRGKRPRNYCPGTDHYRLQNKLDNTKYKAKSRRKAREAQRRASVRKHK